MVKMFNEGEGMHRETIKRILIIVDTIDDKWIGDTILRLSRFKFIHYYFPHAVISINTSCQVWNSIALHLSYIHQITNYSRETIPYDAYELVLLLVECKRDYLNTITECARHKQADIMVASIYNSNLREEEDRRIPFLKEVFEFEYPKELLEDIGKCEIALTEEELKEAEQLLDSYVADEKLIVYFDKSSTYRKLLKMSVNIELIKYFQSLEGKRVVMFDPFGEDKALFYSSLGIDTSNLVIIKGGSIRRNFAVMADKRVELILGPCTGMMHAASGIYNFMLKHKKRSRPPHMLVYTGLYTGNLTNASYWWKGRLVDCIVIKKDEDGMNKVFRLEDISQFQISVQENVQHCREYTSGMIKDHLLLQYNFGNIPLHAPGISKPTAHSSVD